MIESNVYCKQNFREALYDWFLKVSNCEFKRVEKKAEGSTFIKVMISPETSQYIFESDVKGFSPYYKKFGVINYFQYNSRFISANTEGQISKGEMEVGLMLCLRGNDYTSVFRSEFQKLDHIKIDIEFYYKPILDKNFYLKNKEFIGSAIISKIADLPGVTAGNQNPICIDVEFYRHELITFSYSSGELKGKCAAFKGDYITGQFS